MDKNKLMKIQSEYETMEVCNKKLSVEGVSNYINLSLNKIVMDGKEIDEDMIKACKRVNKLSAVNSHLPGDGITGRIIYQDYDRCIEEKCLTDEFVRYQSSLGYVLDESNMEEVYKLAKFTNIKYVSNYRFYEETMRTGIHFLMETSCKTKETTNDRREFRQFFDEKQEALSKPKVMEKA